MVVQQAKKTIKKTTDATKKVATAKKSSAATDKAKTTEASSATTAKKAAVKKSTSGVAKPKQVKVPAVKAAVTTAAVKKTAVKPAATAKKTVNKPKATAAKKAQAQPTPEERYRMVELAAYFIAERSGFQGSAAAHWAAAESEVAAKLGQ